MTTDFQALSTMIAARADVERLLALPIGSEPLELVAEICRIADAIGEDAAMALLAAKPELRNWTPALTAANHAHIREVEFNETERMLQMRPARPVAVGTLLSKEVRVAYDRVGDMFRSVDFSRCCRLVVVGCGPNPLTAFHAYDRTDIPDLIALDVLPDAIEKVRALIAHFGLERMQAEVCDGREFDYRGADIVFVANMVTPKAAVMSRIADTAPAGVQIVARDPYGMGVLWAERAEWDLDPRLTVVGRGRHGWPLSRNTYIRRRPHNPES